MLPGKPDQQTIHKLLDEIEAVTKDRYYQDDPDPITGGLQVFRMPDGAGDGEAFAALSTREKAQVLGDCTPWQKYEELGVSREQLDAVFLNVIQGRPRARWLEGSGLDGADKRPGLSGLRQRAAEAAGEVREEKGRKQERNGRER
jgi:hypothetical protein